MVFMSCMHESKLYSNILFFYTHGCHSYTFTVWLLLIEVLYMRFWLYMYWGNYANSLILLIIFMFVYWCAICNQIVYMCMFMCILTKQCWFCFIVLFYSIHQYEHLEEKNMPLAPVFTEIWHIKQSTLN